MTQAVNDKEILDTRKLCIICHAPQQKVFVLKDYYYYRCPGCGLLSTYPLPDVTTIDNHYKKKFTDGNYRLLQDYMTDYLIVYQGFVNDIKKRFVQNNRSLRGTRILDIGCFTGDLLYLLQAEGADVYGVELQDEAVEIANKKLPNRIYKADIFGEDFPQMKFDVICLMGVIEHVMDPIKLIRRSQELLNDNGFIVIQTPNSGSLLSKVFGKYWPPCAPVEHIHLFSEKGLISVLKSLRFNHISTKAHWKRLPIAYVYNNFKNFGEFFFRLLTPLYQILPQRIRRSSLPFYAGEMVVIAQKNSLKNY